MSLSREQVLAAADTAERVEVPVPEWGGSAWIRSITAAERDQFEASIERGGKVDPTNLRARLVALCLVDDLGKRLFEDETVLAGKSARAVDRLFRAARELNGFTAEAVQGLAKN